MKKDGIDNNDSPVKTMRLKPELVEALKKLAAEQNRNFSNLVETILLRYVGLIYSPDRFDVKDMRGAHGVCYMQGFPHNDLDFETWFKEYMKKREAEFHPTSHLNQ